MELLVDYMGCQNSMCPTCDFLQVCPLHEKIDQLRLENEGLRMENAGLKEALDKQTEMIIRLRGEMAEQATP